MVVETNHWMKVITAFWKMSTIPMRIMIRRMYIMTMMTTKATTRIRRVVGDRCHEEVWREECDDDGELNMD